MYMKAGLCVAEGFMNVDLRKPLIKIILRIPCEKLLIGLSVKYVL